MRAEQDQVRAQLAEQNAAVDALLGQVSVLRQREDAVAAELAEQEAKLADARTDLAEARDALAQTRSAGSEMRSASSSACSSRSTAAASPTPPLLLLDSEDVDDLATRSLYLERIQDYQGRVVGRVRDLRAAASAHVDEVETSIERMEAARAAIAKRQQALAASRATLEQRESALRSAQDRRREQLADLQGEAASLVEALSKPATPDAAAPDSADDRGGLFTPTEQVAPRAARGQRSTPTGRPRRPADAPEAVKGAIAAGNADHEHAVRVRQAVTARSSRSGYDCSGSVSFALHGGGLLSAPLDSTGFMTWAIPGPASGSRSTRTRPRLHGDRRHPLRHLGAPPRWQSTLRDSTGFVATHPPGY